MENSWKKEWTTSASFYLTPNSSQIWNTLNFSYFLYFNRRNVIDKMVLDFVFSASFMPDNNHDFAWELPFSEEEVWCCVCVFVCVWEGGRQILVTHCNLTLDIQPITRINCYMFIDIQLKNLTYSRGRFTGSTKNMVYLDFPTFLHLLEFQQWCKMLLHITE